MIEIDNIQAVNKGSLLAKCDIYIKPWDLELREVKIFEKGSQRWLGMPSRDYVNELGEKKYIPMINFRKDSTKTRFRDQIMTAVDAFLDANPELKTEDLIKEGEELPF